MKNLITQGKMLLLVVVVLVAVPIKSIQTFAEPEGDVVEFGPMHDGTFNKYARAALDGGGNVPPSVG